MKYIKSTDNRPPVNIQYICRKICLQTFPSTLKHDTGIHDWIKINNDTCRKSIWKFCHSTLVSIFMNFIYVYCSKYQHSFMTILNFFVFWSNGYLIRPHSYSFLKPHWRLCLGVDLHVYFLKIIFLYDSHC